ncbi:hypothetical protein JTB14_030004 [Gonioctena quinquepunctata]|nr:hypothetical protein JTB14_030004 [Gonioctena quinquepunctata]
MFLVASMTVIEWIIDSSQVTMKKYWLENRRCPKQEITVANNKKLRAEGSGDVEIDIDSQEVTKGDILEIGPTFWESWTTLFEEEDAWELDKLLFLLEIQETAL